MGLWQLHFENWSGSDLDLNGFAIAVHGKPIGSPAGPVERIMGTVGVDGGAFVPEVAGIVGAQDMDVQFQPCTVPYLLNPETGAFTFYTEKAAGGVNVYAIDNASGQRVAEFLTGADGNYYFDLPAGEYTIGIEDPLGRTAYDEGANFDDEWEITVNTLDAESRISTRNVNFLLDPGSLPADEVLLYRPGDRRLG